MKFKGFFPLLLIMFAWNCHAGEANALVSQNKIGLEDYLTLSLEIKNYEGNVQFPDIPSIEGFDIVSGPSRNQSMSWINGKSSHSITLTYTLVPKNTGSFTIPSFNMSDEKETYTTRPLSITVVQGSIVPKRTNRRRSPFDDDFFRPRNQPQATQDDIYIKTEVSKNSVFQGEGFLVSYRIFTRTPIGDITLKEAPVYPGFLSEDITSRDAGGSSQKIIDGKRYDTAIIYRKILYPINPGNVEIPPVTFRMRVGDTFSFFANQQVIDRKTDLINLTVRELPEPSPHSFSGAIGNFTLSADLDKTEARIGDSISYSVTLKGTGNLNQVESIVPETLEGFKVFKPSSPELIKGENPLITEKKWDIVLVPEQEGTLIVPELKFSFFNPNKKTYITETVESKEVLVAGVNTGTSTTPVVSAGQDILQINDDINYIQVDSTLESFSDISTTFIFKAMTVGIPLSLLILGLGLRITDPARKNPVETRKKRAFFYFRKSLKSATAYLKKGKNKDFYRTLSLAAVRYFADKWNVSTVDLHIDEIEKRLSEQDIDPQLVKNLVNTVEYCDFESYTPSSKGASLSVLKDIEKTIGEMEKLI